MGRISASKPEGYNLNDVKAIISNQSSSELFPHDTKPNKTMDEDSENNRIKKKDSSD